jgi:hypothetical protein
MADLQCLVDALCRKYRKAIANLQVAEQEFHALNSTVDPQLLEEWQAAEAYAMEHRASDVKVMDIYDVQLDTGLSDSHSVLLSLIFGLSSGACKLSAGAQSERAKGWYSSRNRGMAGERSSHTGISV